MPEASNNLHHCSSSNTFTRLLDMNITDNTKTFLIISVGLIAISTASIFIRMADEVPSLVIAAYRLSIAGIVLSGISLKRGLRLFDLSERRILLLTFIAGIALALHFAFWIESLRHTTVASSVVLVYTSPIWAAAIAHFFLDEKLTLKQSVGIAIALSGAAAIALSGNDDGNSSLTGNLLAIGGGMMGAVYLSVGRVLRRRKSALSYSGSVYLTAAILIILGTFISGSALTGYTPKLYILLLLIGLIPQLIGHTAFNWALKRRSAVTVSVLMLGEPIGATLLAALFLFEIPVTGEIIGGAILLFGIYLSSINMKGKND